MRGDRVTVFLKTGDTVTPHTYQAKKDGGVVLAERQSKLIIVGEQNKARDYIEWGEYAPESVLAIKFDHQKIARAPKGRPK